MTKLISFAPALATLALMATVGAASAENTFQLDRARSTTSSVVLSNVQADQAGSVQVFGYDANGNVTQFLGSTRVAAGTNGDVAVALNQPSTARLQILMSNGNHSVATIETQAPLTN